MKKAALVLALALIPSVQAAPAPAATAQDLFDEVIYQLASFYSGPSDVRAGDLRRKYLPEVQKLCDGKPECAAEQAYGLIEQMLGDLKDAHTNFYTPSQLEEVGKLLLGEQGQRRTFGAVTEALGTGGRVVLEVLPGSAAERTGWKAGDVLRRVNGVALDGQAGQAALGRASARGTPARFEGTRQGKTMNTALTAAPLQVTPVSLSLRADGLAVLRLRHFNTPGVGQQVHDALRKVQAAGTKGVILDLRWNSGGRVEEFLLSAGAFTDPAPLFLKTRVDTAKIGYGAGRYLVNGKAQEQPRIKTPARYTGPLVVLVDEGTASSAEFLTRTLLGRPSTQVIGETTAGVGDTATRFVPLTDGSGLQLTFARMLDAREQPLGTRITPQVGASVDLAGLTRTGRDSVVEQAATLLSR
ncbi:peptidase S41 [Deinococcus sp. SDU3-2]|uniref:Peptidase S41 n=1 Tax=Deinococcus terrestris TaxID=2651870 RepID=A0A7X1TSJ9_9DEIO|nr:S41 family peptidase [Deinococcus terrestris]MPY67918.1 peptidase S41 [Deinococcus terrestris]